MIAAGRRSKTSRIASWIVSQRHRLGAEGLDVETDRLRLADGVGHLHLAAPGQPGRDDVLGDPAHGVGGGAVDLRRVLAGEGAATVPGHAAVGVDDDLATGEPGVAHRAADLEATGRVDEEPVTSRCRCRARRRPALTTWSAMSGWSRFSSDDVARVLCGHDDGVERDGAVTVVRDRDLGLAVGPQVGISPFLRTSESRWASRCASQIGSGMCWGVSSQAYPNMSPWSPAPWRSKGRDRPRRAPRTRCRHPGRCPATANRSTPRRRRTRRRSPWWRSRTRCRGRSDGRSPGSRRTPRSSPRRRRGRARS